MDRQGSHRRASETGLRCGYPACVAMGLTPLFRGIILPRPATNWAPAGHDLGAYGAPCSRWGVTRPSVWGGRPARRGARDRPLPTNACRRPPRPLRTGKHARPWSREGPPTPGLLSLPPSLLGGCYPALLRRRYPRNRPPIAQGRPACAAHRPTHTHTPTAATTAPGSWVLPGGPIGSPCRRWPSCLPPSQGELEFRKQLQARVAVRGAH